MDTDSQHQLILEARHGSQEAFRQLVVSSQAVVYGLCLRVLCHEQEAEEAVQDAFIRAWEHLDDYDERQSRFSTWVSAIAARLCLDLLRRKRIQPQPADEEQLRRFASETDTERRLESSEWVAIVRAMTAELSPKQQLVFSLRIFDDMEPTEIEQVTGMSVDKIKHNLYVARQKIKEQLKRLGYGR